MNQTLKSKILVVDDEKNIREGLKKYLDLEGYETILAGNGLEALKVFEAGECDLIITDLKMPGLLGSDLLRKVIRSPLFEVPVIVLTGHGSVENAVETMRDGAYDFLMKPINLKKLSLVIKRALGRKALELENRELRRKLDEKFSFSNITGNSAPMQRVFEIVQQVAPSNANILITGENGTGKELIANSIHQISSRVSAPMIKVHCGALSETVLESEFFGHERGAFTGAISQRKGRFELADGGTLFLDEIGDISLLVQVKLLRVIQEREFERVGSEKTIRVDVRLICATNKDLLKEVEAGRFREDLYFRLNVITVPMPLLRDRHGDIPILVHRFLKEFCEQNRKPLIRMSNKALARLDSYSWPGNIRELRNVIESCVVMSQGSIIQEKDLPANIFGGENHKGISVALGSSLEELEKSTILSTLSMTGQNKSKTAKILGIGRKTLHRKLQSYGMQQPKSESK